MITYLINAAAWCGKHRLQIVSTFLLFIAGMYSKAQTQKPNFVFTATSESTFGWKAMEAGWGMTKFDTDSGYAYQADSAKLMTVSRASDSIANMKITIAAKLATAAFTGAAIISALGFTPYNATNPSSYLTATTGDTRYPQLSGSYSNPSWITALAQSKVTYTGTTAQYIRGDGSLATTPLGSVTSVGLTSTDFSVSGSPVTSSGNITANLNTSGVSAGTYNSSYTVNNKGIITAAVNAIFNTAPARVLSTTGSNNTFTISASKNARVHYTINFAFALTLTTSNGYVQLDYSTDGGSTWITCGSVSSVYSLSVTLTGNTDAELSGEIPANALVRLYRINNTNVTITASTSKQLEITY